MSDEVTRAPWQLTGMHHLGLTVRDVERSIHFYRDLLGLPLVGRREATADYVARQTGYPGLRLAVATFALAANGGPLLQIAQYLNHQGEPSDQKSNRPGNSHLCLVVNDIHAAYQELTARGVRCLSEPVEITAGPHQGGFGLYLFDPDGYTIELHQPRQPPKEK